jgi:hypothetical protein
MKNKTLRCFLFLILLSNILIAQELYVCESYTEDGTPVGPLISLEIKPYGTAIYVLLNNGKAIQDPILYLFIDKLVGGKFTPFESKTLSVKKTDTWAVTSFEFKDPGIYELYFLNSSQSRLATGKLEVYFAQDDRKFTFYPKQNSVGGVQFTFCELVINGKPKNPFTSLSLSRSEGQAFIYLKNQVPFGIEKIKVQVWRRSNKNSNYEELVDSKKFKILPEWSDTFFKYNFVNIGEYKIDIFDINDNFISSNIITVTN